MSRKARQKDEDGAEQQAVRYWGASFGYSVPKGSAVVGGKLGSGQVVVLHLPDDPAAGGAEAAHPIRSLAPAARCVLAGGGAAAPPAVVVVDLSALFGSPGEAREALDAEGEQAGEPSKALGKPAARALAKLLPKGATLVARGGAAQLALKLLSGLGPRLRPGDISRLVLVHPRLPSKCINTLLVRARFTQQLCAVFESEEALARRQPVLQPAFAESCACFACAGADEALLRGLLGLEGGEPLPQLLGVEDADEAGQTLQAFHLSVSMDPGSKQYRADVEEASHLLAAEDTHDEADSSAVGATADGEAPAEVAALVVRGCRCVLVRSLDSPPAWRGMRLPFIAQLPGEEPQTAAVRSVSELCDIDGASELVPLPILPVEWHRGPFVVPIHFFKAVHPPQGALEDADMEDDEDLYDWYTWPRAMHALRGDPWAVMALQSAALALMAAAVAGRMPFQWGGIFGQEWLGGVNAEGPVASLMARALPGLPVVSTVPVECVRSNCDHGDRGPKDSTKLLPVTVLSGFLGAGKTTLLKHILRSSGQGGQTGDMTGQGCQPGQAPSKIAVIVNDMGEVNLDASEIKNSRLIQEDATMVELHNGCICCTLRGDLLKTVKSLSEEMAFDYLVIESTGISEPLPVAQTFVMDVEGAQVANVGVEGSPTDTRAAGLATVAVSPQLKSLSNFARLDTMVTVVDALNIYEVLGSLETLAEKNTTSMVGNTGVRDDAAAGSQATSCTEHGEGEHADHEHREEVDDRSIAQLMLDQIEFANVILLSKVHLVKQGATAVEEIRALLQKLNPCAKVIAPTEPHFASVPLNAVIDTHLFDMEKAQVSAGWIQELAKTAEGGAGHTPETEEYGISSVVFRSSERPFHPGRLGSVLTGFGDYASSMAAATDSEGDSRGGVFSGVVRAKGQLWVAGASEHPVDFHAAGRHMQLAPSAMPYLAAVSQLDWDEAQREIHKTLLAEGAWHAVHGDRQSEVVFIGVKLNRARILAELDAALATSAEIAGCTAGWNVLEDAYLACRAGHPAKGLGTGGAEVIRAH